MTVPPHNQPLLWTGPRRVRVCYTATSPRASRCRPQSVIRYTAMATRCRKFAVVGSTIMFVVVVVAWLLAGRIDPRDHAVDLPGDWHVSIDAKGADGRLEIFRGPVCGPFHPVLLPGVVASREWPKCTSFNFAGVYFCHIRWPEDSPFWSFSISLLYPLLLAAVYPGIWLFQRVRHPPRGFPVGGTPVAV